MQDGSKYMGQENKRKWIPAYNTSAIYEGQKFDGNYFDN